MADGLEFTIDGGALDRDVDRLLRRYLTYGTQAVANATKNLERRLEALTRAATPSQLWRVWASETFPKSGPARNPVGRVFVRGSDRIRRAMVYWTRPGAIRGSHGQFLAIPLPAAGKWRRGSTMTPGEWERRTGLRLRFVYRRGRSSLLVTDGVLNSRSGTARRQTGIRERGRAGLAPRATTTIPIFVLVPLVKFRNAFAIEPEVSRSEHELAAEYIALASAG